MKMFGGVWGMVYIRGVKDNVGLFYEKFSLFGFGDVCGTDRGICGMR